MRRKYRQQDVRTPYEKLKSLPDAKSHLKDNASFDELDRIAYATSDLDAVRRVNDARRDRSTPSTSHRPMPPDGAFVADCLPPDRGVVLPLYRVTIESAPAASYKP